MLHRTTVIAVLLVALAVPNARAQDTYPIGPAGYLYGGLVIVNGLVTVANGITILSGTASERNGKFGIGLGAATGVVGIAIFALADDGEEAGALLTGVGLADLLLGVAAKRASAARTEETRLVPIVRPTKGGAEVGFRLRF